MSICSEIAEIIVLEAETCIGYLHVDATIFLWRARRVVEVILLWMQADEGLELSKEPSQRTIEDLAKIPQIKKRLEGLKDLPTVARYGNEGAHIRLKTDTQEPANAAATCASALGGTLSWFLNQQIEQRKTPEDKFPRAYQQRLQEVAKSLQQRIPWRTRELALDVVNLEKQVTELSKSLESAKEQQRVLTHTLEERRRASEHEHQQLLREREIAAALRQSLGALEEQHRANNSEQRDSIAQQIAEAEKQIQQSWQQRSLKISLLSAALGALCVVLGSALMRPRTPHTQRTAAIEHSTPAPVVAQTISVATASDVQAAPLPEPASRGISVVNVPPGMECYDGGSVPRNDRPNLTIESVVGPFCISREQVSIEEVRTAANTIPELTNSCRLRGAAIHSGAYCDREAADRYCRTLGATLPSTAHWLFFAQRHASLQWQEVEDAAAIFEWTATRAPDSRDGTSRWWTRKARRTTGETSAYVLNDLAAMREGSDSRACFRCVMVR